MPRSGLPLRGPGDRPTSYRRVHAPIRAHHVTDDPWALRSAVADMHRHYARSRVDFVATTPRPGHSIGHSGLFRASTGAEHWPALATWLTSTPSTR